MGINYVMSQARFDGIIETRKGEDKKKNPYDYVKDYLNEQDNLRGEVIHITIKG
jgi:hypothetical protein